MNIEEIQQAITELLPEELAHFRKWFREYENNIDSDTLEDSQQFRERLKKLRGSLKGSGALKALMEERCKESLL